MIAVIDHAGKVEPADMFSVSVERLIARSSVPLSALDAICLVAAREGVAKDTRTLAKAFETSHALVLRAVTMLEADHGLVTVEDRAERSGRLFFALTEEGHALFAERSQE